MDESLTGKAAEKERQLKEIFDAFLLNRKQETAARVEHPDEWLSTRVESLPTRARVDVLEYDKSLAEDGVSDPEKRSKYVESRISAFEQTYQDRRFTVGKGEHMLKKEYAKEQASDWLNEALGEEPELEDLKKVALLNFDANGLKAVNDLSGSHEKGTEYLRRIAEIFHDQDSQEALWMKSKGIEEILPVTAGGDEYSVMIRANTPIDPAVIDKAIRMYEAAISAIDTSDLVDFSSDETRLRFLGVSEKQYMLMGEAEKKKLMDDFESDFPDGFKMRASASGGGGTLFDGLMAAVEHPTKPIKPTDSFGRSTEKIIGGTWDAADKSALENKNVYKESLRAESASAEDKFYSKVLARTSEARVQEAKIDAMAQEIKKNETMESELQELDDLMDKGLMDEASYGKNMREIRKKYRTQA